jgi:hypothetical protein
MDNIRTFNRNTNGRTYPELVVSRANEKENAYQAALKLVAQIDEDLTKGIRHYRTKSGQLLTTLDQVITAILEDNLFVPEVKEEAQAVWMQELAA